MLEIVKVVAMACAVAPGGHGRDLGKNNTTESTAEAAVTALNVQLLCQIEVSKCLEEQKFGEEGLTLNMRFNTWHRCLAKALVVHPK